MATVIGSNVDPRHWVDLEALAADLKAHNVAVVRTVLKSYDDPTAWSTALHRHGLSLLSVFALESFEGFYTFREAITHYSNFDFDYLQLGNESDVDCRTEDNCSSWYQTQEEVSNMGYTAREIMPTAFIIGPGLAAGDPHWLDTFDAAPFDAIAAHLYGNQTVDEFVSMWAPYSPAPIWITEYPYVEYTRELNDDPRVHCALHFCWSLRMHPLGICEREDKLAEFTVGAAESGTGAAPGGEVAQPEYILGFADYAAMHPEVGDPVTNQFTERTYIDQVSHTTHEITAQETSEGTLRYFPEANAVRFSPKGDAG